MGNHSAKIGVLAILCLSLAGSAWMTRDSWMVWRDSSEGQEEETSDPHGGHRHDEPSLHLSTQSRINLGLITAKIRLREYERCITVPAMVVERTGRTHIQVAAPLTGVVMDIRVVRGQAVRSGNVLFKLRLTHEDLVVAQANFLQTLGELDVEQREVARLEKLTERELVRGTRLVERKYARDKLDAALRAQRESLLLHGLSQNQIDQIQTSRKLLRELDVLVPLLHDDHSIHDDAETPHPSCTNSGLDRADEPDVDDAKEFVQEFVVQQLEVKKGQSVQAGDSLCMLADYSELFVEGRAFEHEADAILDAAKKEWGVTALFPYAKRQSQVSGLRVVYLNNEIETSTRAITFYVPLPNKLVHETEADNGARFLTWQFKPGQRLQLKVPIERWKDQIVLPNEAVVDVGVDQVVFLDDGHHLTSQKVRVVHRDEQYAVVANNGALKLGARVVVAGAHQVQMAINRSNSDDSGGHGHIH